MGFPGDHDIGFIGTGLMGAPMVRNLIKAGRKPVIFNRTRAKMTPLIEAGALAADSPADVAGQVGGGIIVICANDTSALETIVRGGDDDNGVIAMLGDGAGEGTLVIDMGTSTVSATRALAGELAAKACLYVDAPVSGGAIGAEAGTLTIMAGGSAEAFARARPVLEVFGGTITHIGDVGAGQVAKAVNQLIVAMTLEAVAEGLVLAEAAGADPAKVREALLGGFAASRILEVHGQRMIDRAFAPGGRAETQLKDLRQALDLAGGSGVVLPGLEKTTELWADMVGRGWGGLDQAGIVKLVEALSDRARED